MGFMALVNLVAIVLLGSGRSPQSATTTGRAPDGSGSVFVAEQASLPGVLGRHLEQEARLAAGVTSLQQIRFVDFTSHPRTPAFSQPRGLSLEPCYPGCQRRRRRSGADALPR